MSRTCQFCGKKFEGSTDYCSSECQKESGSDDGSMIKVCKNCGKTYANRSSEYCSTDCFNEAI